MSIEIDLANQIKLLRRDLDETKLQIQRPAPIPSAYGNVISLYLSLFGLRAFWPYTVLGGSGNTNLVKDISGNGLHLTRNGGTIYLYGTSGTGMTFANASYQGTRYDDRATEAALNIGGDGTEGMIVSTQRGLTIGAWIRTTTDNPTAITGIMGKYLGSVGQRQYLLGINTPTDNRARFIISNDGTAINSAYNSTELVGAGSGWNYVVGKFDPNVPELVVWVNDVKGAPVATAYTGIYTSGTTSFQIGRYGGDANTQFQGRLSLPFLVAAAVPDWQIQMLYHQTKALFGV